MILLSPKRPLATLFSTIALAAALCATSVAQAGVLDFEGPNDGPLVFAGDVQTIGKYYVEGAGTPGFVGTIAGSDSCDGPQCPANNATTYYSGVDDGYMFFGLADGSRFTLGTIDASFIGTGGTYGSVAGLLYIAAFNATGLVAEIYLDLAGPTGGAFNFATYDLSAFGNGLAFTDVLVASYACDDPANCDRTRNQANFAIDNIVTIDAVAVPEPGSLALFLLGMLGLGAIARRRT